MGLVETTPTLQVRYWENVTPACMTEESDSENGEKIVLHSLLWRSECESHDFNSSHVISCDPLSCFSSFFPLCSTFL